MDLLPFQARAAGTIAERFHAYMQDPLTVTRTQLVPFYQNLSAITGSGKTLILADTIEQIRTRLPLEPIVLWLSKGRVVVVQTLTNLSTGKYAELIGGYDVKALLDCEQRDVEDSRRGLLLVATVGKFNQKDKEEGDRRIFKVGFDAATESLWNLLRKRRDREARRRPLLIVYDEGHNLSNQQTTLLAELQPDALLAASATMRVPDALSKTIDRLREDKKWKDSDFVCQVSSGDVVAAGLVKKHIMLGGYVAPMEVCVDDLHREMKAAEKATRSLGLGFLPKAIYVSTTNTVDGSTPREDSTRPFKDRRARPILIWRHLVEKQRIDPNTIAVYCDLRFDKDNRPPSGFHLFSGGDDDYDRFIAGGYRHIIFNLSLQEGWDDPACCFAYVDKEMGSPDQVTQVVGRVLRQPGARHYEQPALNTAHFYVRTDEKGVFEAIVDDVRREISGPNPDITITVRGGVARQAKTSLEPRKERIVPSVSIDSADAQPRVRRIVNDVIDFTGDQRNVRGTGARIQVLQTIGTADDAPQEWVDIEHSNTVTARWIFAREIQTRHPKALHLCDIEHPKFDVMVEYHSAAAQHLREKAEAVVGAYIQHSRIVQNALDHPYAVGPIAIAEAKLERFKNALHDGYSDLNELEKAFARALDKTKRTWARNPVGGGFAIPLLDSGSTRQFKPDFLVWSNGHVVAIDTKGDHLIVEDSARKLFDIPRIEDDGPYLVVRLVTEGEWHVNRGTPERRPGSARFTVWRLKQGRLDAVPCESPTETVNECLAAVDGK